MKQLKDVLKNLGISKVKLAKFLGVSRQMIYNYLELESLDKWPRDKKNLLLNLLGLKTVGELENLEITSDYILTVETKLCEFLDNSKSKKTKNVLNDVNLGKKENELLIDITNFIKERLDGNDIDSYNTFKYMYDFMLSMDSSKETKYMLSYVAKATGFVKPLEFAFNEDEQYAFEAIMFLAMTLFKNGTSSKSKIEVAHKRFASQIAAKLEEKMDRTMKINTNKLQALKELNYTEVTTENASEVLAKIVEIESRKVN